MARFASNLCSTQPGISVPLNPAGCPSVSRFRRSYATIALLECVAIPPVFFVVEFVAGVAKQSKISGIIGPTERSWDHVMDLQVRSMTAAGTLAHVTVFGHDLAAGCRGDRGGIAFTGSADLTIASRLFLFRFADLQLTPARLDRSLLTRLALMDVDLHRWFRPPGAFFRSVGLHDFQQCFDLVGRYFALLAKLLPERFIPRELSWCHFHTHPHGYDNRCCDGRLLTHSRMT